MTSTPRKLPKNAHDRRQKGKKLSKKAFKDPKKTAEEPPKTPASLPPLVFIHGLLGTPDGLAEIITELRRLYAEYDLPAPPIHAPLLPPGDGATLPEYTADAYADFIAEFIEVNRLERPILIGHSMGSLVATATAVKYPELISDRLILLAPISAPTARTIASLQPLVAVLPNRFISLITTLYNYAHRPEPGNPARFWPVYHRTVAGGTRYPDKRSLAASARFSAKTALTDFSPPEGSQVRLIAGDRDYLFSQSATRLLAESWGAEYEFIKNSGHLLNYERPQAVAEAIWKITTRGHFPPPKV